MNRFRFFTPALMAMLALTLFAFKKEATPVRPGKSTFTFTTKSLVMTSFQLDPAIDLDGDGKLDHDLMAFLRPCERDNAIVFEKNGKIVVSNGQLSCTDGQADPSTIKASNWSYNEATKTIRIINPAKKTAVTEWKVLETTAEGLRVEVPQTEGGKSYRAIMTWKTL